MPRYKLVIFDMDGTLTEEILDFAAIRTEIGMPLDGGIIEHITKLPLAEQDRAKDILHRHEITAAGQCGIKDGTLDALSGIRAAGVKTALLTRNSLACTSLIMDRHGLTLDYIATRENLPHKPHADSILNITRRFSIDPRQTLMVGDYLYDLQAANAAGTDSALLCDPTRPRPPFADLATLCIENLRDILPLLAAS